MKQLLLTLLCLLALVAGVSAQSQQRRPIDNEHPIWLIHIDVWNKADPQKIIDLIPADVRPYVCMNLSLSCGYDTERNVHKMPQNAIPTYKSWASVCQQNGLWFTCQPASGGHTHILDDDIETFEYFFKHYPNFLGWNFAEQFWGFDEPGDRYSSPLVNRIALFARLVEMSHNYGGMLTISFCGNIWSHPLNPVGMMKSNADLLAACQKYPDAILWLYKYTTSSCFYNNESVSFGPFVAGLASNYGVRYDNCGWNDALKSLLGENNGRKYPVAAGIGTVMEQTACNGGAVWDGPELIWTEDFQNLSDSRDSYGFTRRNWGTFPGFDNAWIDMWRKVLDGTLYIPSRQEVVERTQVIIVNDVTSGSDEDKYTGWGDLYDGLYKQTDPFNRGNGQFMDNLCYFKRTGRYGAIPIAPVLNDDLARAIPLQVQKSKRRTVWPSQTAKVNRFNELYPVVSTGDLFVSRHKNQLVTYTPFTYFNTKKTASAKVALQYNTCDSLYLTYGLLSSGLVREWRDSITFYLNNYRTDTTRMVEDRITIVGAKAQPQLSIAKRGKASMESGSEWDAERGTYTLSVRHNGPVDVVIHCQGNASERRTDVAPSSPLGIPVQPAPFYGTVIKEAEDMEYKNITSCVTDPYNWYPTVFGHAGNGFMDMGTNKEGQLKAQVRVNRAGKYRVTVRYMSASKSASIRLKVGTVERALNCAKTDRNCWGRKSYEFTMTEGNNNVLLTNAGGVACYIDQISFTPVEIEEEQFPITFRASQYGSAEVVDAATGEVVTQAVEGTQLVLRPLPNPGYVFVGWNIVHGKYFSIADDGSFRMPDDLITLEPLFIDQTTVYAIDFSHVLTGTLPAGWVSDQGGEVHAYPNSYNSGSRTITGFPGTYNKGLYWRVNRAEYGTQPDYKLVLQPGKYRLRFAMAAWKGAPSYRAMIVTPSGNALAQTDYFTAAPTAGGKETVDLSAATLRTLEFEVRKESEYLIRFENQGSAFSEFLLLACSINSVGGEQAITEVMMDGLDADQCTFYSVEGERLPGLQRGVNLIVRQGNVVRKVFVR